MKLCSKCGKQCVDQAFFCDKCGTHFGTAGQAAPVQQQPPVNYAPQSQYPPQNQYPAQPSAQMPNYPGQPMYQAPPQKDYRKMGGWLLFFVILNIIMAVSSLGLAINEIRSSIEALDYGYYETALTLNIVGQIVAIAGIALVVMFIIQVFQRKPLFLRFEQLTRIVSFVSGILTMIAIGMIDSSDVTANPAGLVGAAIGFFLMTLYYCKSVRVRTYMGSDEYMGKAIFRYKQPPLSPMPTYQPAPGVAYPQQNPHSYQQASYQQQMNPQPVPTVFQPTQAPPAQPPVQPQAPQTPPATQNYSEATTVLVEPQNKVYKEVFCASCGYKYLEGETRCFQCGSERS